MPGSPPTSPNLGIPRYADTDTAAFSSQVNPITDTVDALFPSGALASIPAAGVRGRKYYATDVNQVYFDTGITGTAGSTTNWLLLAGAPTGVLTALPTSPADGQVISLLADSTNGVVWHFRYRAGSGSTYKWEFIGGPPLYASASNAGVSSTGSYQGATAFGTAPSVTIPTLPNGGDFDVEIGASSFTNVSGGQSAEMFTSFAAGTIAATDANSFQADNVTGAPVEFPGALRARVTGVASAAAFTVQYKIAFLGGGAGVGACEWYNPRIAVWPVRVG